ncbi:gas vesicle protein [Dactylosporangium roseum]|uniref:Gas vesicle protein n=1 Tax=Dactylosporangium roseum TaxID=47989 RepID=A0ABY5YWT7_9ACTN|nr:gas vesicle protein GvpJ [Dactylosporangium roseum]UWZ33992.1 gas vesicle protein [Dactylosporangium roseum]
MTQPVRAQPVAPAAGGHQPTNLADILERVLDRGLVIAGDIQVNLLDIELLTVKLRLLIASVDTARQLGINWWESDPFLTGGDRRAVEERRAPAVRGERAARRELEDRREYEDREYEDRPARERDDRPARVRSREER